MSTVQEILATKGSEVLMIPPNLRVERVAQRMRQAHVGAFVVSHDGVHVDGLVSERDLVEAVARHGRAALDQPVSAVMAFRVLTCGPGDSVRSVMATMTHERVRHLPVVRDGEVCGIISIGDLIKTYVDETSLEASVMRDFVLAQRAR